MKRRETCYLLLTVALLTYCIHYVGITHDRSITIETEKLETLPEHRHDHTEDAGADDGHGVYIFSQPHVILHDTWVTSIDFTTVNAPPSSIHHALLYDGAPHPTSMKPGGGDRFFLAFGADQMYNPHMSFPDGYALKIPAGTHLVLESMLHNPAPPIGPGGTYHDVRVQVVLHTVSAVRNIKSLSFELLTLIGKDDCTNAPYHCGSFTVPPHELAYTFAGADTFPFHHITFAKASHIRYWGAHMHGFAGAKELVLKRNGAPMSTFKAVHSDTDPFLYTSEHAATDVPIHANDTLSIEATYENNANTPLRGAMGILGLFVSEDD